MPIQINNPSAIGSSMKRRHTLIGEIGFIRLINPFILFNGSIKFFEPLPWTFRAVFKYSFSAVSFSASRPQSFYLFSLSLVLSVFCLNSVVFRPVSHSLFRKFDSGLHDRVFHQRWFCFVYICHFVLS